MALVPVVAVMTVVLHFETYLLEEVPCESERQRVQRFRSRCGHDRFHGRLRQLEGLTSTLWTKKPLGYIRAG